MSSRPTAPNIPVDRPRNRRTKRQVAKAYAVWCKTIGCRYISARVLRNLEIRDRIAEGRLHRARLRLHNAEVGIRPEVVS